MSLRVIDPNITRLMIRNKKTIKHYPGRLCSCVGENSGMPLLNHTCNQGYFYDTPETIEAIRTQISYKVLNSPQGRILNGGATFIIPKMNLQNIEQKAYSTIATGDVLVDTTSTRRDTDILCRGIRDKIYAFDVKEILSIYAKETRYLHGEQNDFTIAENVSVAGKLTEIIWNEGKGPADREYYTVEFICQQQFKVWEDAGNDRGTDQDNLPKKILSIMRRFVNPEKDNPIDQVDTQGDIF